MLSRTARATFLLAMLIPGMVAARDCVHSTPQWAQMSEQDLVLERADGTRLTVRARIADDWQERAAGYQHICPAVIERSRVLFVFDTETASRFHMNNVRGDLDIGFFAADGTLIEVMRMRAPAPGGPSSLYGPSRPFRYALEAAPGFFADNGLHSGTTLLDPSTTP